MFFLPGSYTVELTLLSGFLMVCLVFCIYAALYLHDKTVLEAAAMQAAERGRLYRTEFQNPQTGEIDWDAYNETGILTGVSGSMGVTETAEYMKQLVKGRLTVSREPEVSVKTGSGSVTVSYSSQTILKGVWPVGELITVPSISGQAVSSRIDAEEFVRLARAARMLKE